MAHQLSFEYNGNVPNVFFGTARPDWPRSKAFQRIILESGAQLVCGFYDSSSSESTIATDRDIRDLQIVRSSLAIIDFAAVSFITASDRRVAENHSIPVLTLDLEPKSHASHILNFIASRQGVQIP